MPSSMLKSETSIHEELLQKWILLSQIIKNNRLVGDISHIEVLILYLATTKNNSISVKELIDTTKILKSQMNRTLNNMIKKNWIIKQKIANDKRCQEILLTPLGQNIILNTHKKILSYSKTVVDIISENDALELIRIFSKFIEKQQDFK